MAPSLDIILVNRNSGHHLRECLASMAGAARTGVELRRVVVVDDVSTDDSLQGIDAMDLPLTCIRNPVRTGYGGSCNRGAAGSEADYLLFLNTDTRLREDSLTVPVRFLQAPENAGVAIVGIKLLGADGTASRSSARFPTLRRYFVIFLGLDRLFPSLFLSHQMKEWDHLSTREVDQVMGAFMMMRREVLDRLGGYDKRFFVYMEDLDLSLRARALGYQSVYLSTAAAIHLGGGTANRVKSESLFFLFRSRIQYGFKHFGTLRGLVLLLATVMLEPISRLVLAGWRGSLPDMRATLAAYLRLWGALPALLSHPATASQGWDAASQPQSSLGSSKLEN